METLGRPCYRQFKPRLPTQLLVKGTYISCYCLWALNFQVAFECTGKTVAPGLKDDNSAHRSPNISAHCQWMSTAMVWSTHPIRVRQNEENELSILVLQKARVETMAPGKRLTMKLFLFCSLFKIALGFLLSSWTTTPFHQLVLALLLCSPRPVIVSILLKEKPLWDSGLHSNLIVFLIWDSRWFWSLSPTKWNYSSSLF